MCTLNKTSYLSLFFFFLPFVEKIAGNLNFGSENVKKVFLLIHDFKREKNKLFHWLLDPWIQVCRAKWPYVSGNEIVEINSDPFLG